jgi:4-alpha-glucanotransferase
MKRKRSSGILLHPTSLPGTFGIGDFGPEAYKWVDFLSVSGCGLWQVLPFGPTGYANSPYQCFSSLAGNPLFISLDFLLQNDLLLSEDIQNATIFPEDRVDFDAAIPWKLSLLRTAFERQAKRKVLKLEFREFRERHKEWLDDFALFMALKDAHDLRPWVSWSVPLRERHPEALAWANEKYATQIDQHAFNQFLFFHQWDTLHEYATRIGVRIVGDLPIYVAHDSVDVWVNPDLFYLDDSGNPTVVAGVPPDYFTADGQLWGNPLYRWDVHAERNFEWWIERIRMMFYQFDVVRLDHFRGFAGYWEVPASHETARHGQWRNAPGEKFFHALKEYFGDLPFIAEDLGEITPDVFELRDRFGIPGTRVMQFGFGSDMNHPFLPHNYTENFAVYTSTHDNETIRGWYLNANEGTKAFVRDYLRSSEEDVVWNMIQKLWCSKADFAIVPAQDLLGLGNEARMNVPGTTENNWEWRMRIDALGDDIRQKLLELNHECGRLSN